MRYFIIGFKNSGKTTFGKLLAKRLQMDFLDMDEFIEKKNGEPIPQIYSRVGEKNFRHLEWKALKEIAAKDNIVVSTGGGVPCNCDNMDLMEKNGEVIYLNVDNRTLINRLKIATKDRPIVLGKTAHELENYLNDLRARCEHHYLRAKYIVNGADPKLEEVVALLKR